MNIEEGLEDLVVTSIYNTEHEYAFVTVVLGGDAETGYDKVRLIGIWEESGTEGDFFKTLAATAADTYLFNGERIDGKVRSELRDIASAKGPESTECADPFKYSIGKIIFSSLRGNNQIAKAECDGWERLQAQLSRKGTQQAAAVLAFLQAIIYADSKLGTGNEFFGSLSTVEPRPTNHFY